MNFIQQLVIHSLKALALMCVLLQNSQSIFAADYFVSSASDIANTLQNLAGPGDTLIMTDGTWTNQTINFSDNGTSGNPITLRAQTPGQVILNGTSTLNISGDWLVVDGLRFEGGAIPDPDSDSAIVEFRGSNGDATNSRFINSAIINYNPTDVDERYHWVELFGQNNRVENNRFEGQNHSGVTIAVRRNDSSAQHHVIAQNHFVDRPEPVNPSSTNGFETIRIGTSSNSLSDSFTTVENNLFERVDGEIEIISNKSGNNTFRHNTFRNSEGTLTLRHGDNNRVDGNFFLGENNSRSGAIRVIGEGQTIVNNYIANVDDRAGGAISLTAGVVNSPPNRYFQVKDAVIAHNTIVNVNGPAVIFDYLYDPVPDPDRDNELQNLRPENVTLANNIFRSDGPTIFTGVEGSNWTWEGNIAFGGSLGPKSGDAGISNVDPELLQDSEGLWRPSGTSPAIDGGQGSYSGLLTDDMDGQPRVGTFDIGADEFSVAAIVRKPLVANDVGPSWLQDPIGPPGGSGCFANGCAIQAEDYSAILDPNGDSAVWTTMTVAEALGGEVIVAPSGSNASSSNHDTIAVYELTFETAGTYTAYYRARGEDGGSNSIFTPDDFDTDPDDVDHLSDNNEFRWDEGITFNISQGDVGLPLEFRIGRREQDTQLDALVLNLDDSLTPEELDALFDVVIAEGDFQEDGDVDLDDLLAWQAGHGTLTGASHMQGDADEDGDVDGRDFLIWQSQFTGSATLLAATTQVPEPSSALLAMLGVTLFQMRQRNIKKFRLI